MVKFALWYDVETTGLHVKKGAAIIQFAGLLVKEGEVIAEINLNINPGTYNRETTIDPVALEINGHKEKDFPGYDSLDLAVAKIMDVLTKLCPDDKVTLCGYNNSTFDKFFLEDMFEDQGKSFPTYFHWKQIDVFEGVKFLDHLGFMPDMFNQKLGTVAEALGVKAHGDLHDALVDVQLTRNIALHIQKQLQED